MIKLGELIYTILREFTSARVKAKLFGAQMAADFRDNEFLRHFTIPEYNIGRAEVTINYAVAKVQGKAGKKIATAVEKVSGQLPEQTTLRNAFTLYKNQKKHWQQKVVPSIVQKIQPEYLEALPIDQVIKLYRNVVENYYLQNLLEAIVSQKQIMEGLETGYTELVGKIAGQMLNQELEDELKKVEVAEKKSKVEELKIGTGLTSKLLDYELFVIVSSEKLNNVDNIATLKLELEEEFQEPIVQFQKSEESHE